MRAHEEDLRVEVRRELKRDEVDDADERARHVAADIAAQGSEAAADPRLRAILQFTERLTLRPGDVEEEHLFPLREQGLDDRAIHDAVQVVSYFNYINRIADGLGVDPEPEHT